MRYGSAEAREGRAAASRVRPGALVVIAFLTACSEAAPAPATERSGAGAPDRADEIGIEERRSIPGEIVFVSERDGSPQVYVIRPDGEAERPLLAHDGPVYPASVSPDGATVLVTTVEERVEGGRTIHLEQILSVPVSGGAVRPIAPAAGRARNPAWSPDGRAVIFESDLASFRDLYRARSGSSLERLTEDEEGNFEPDPSPDGRYLAFVSSRDGNAEIYRMDAEGGEHVRLTAFHTDDTRPRWSPDGRSIAFLSDREGASRIFLMAPDGTGQRRLTGAVRPDSHEDEPAWSPDATRIAYTLRGPDGEGEILVLEVGSGKRTSIAAPAASPAWSPDGRYIAFVSSATGESQIHIARADGSSPTRVTLASGPNWLPRWIPSPAGQRPRSSRP